MTIFRKKHQANYTVVQNSMITDKRLSYKAKGILLYAMSRPDNWTFYLTDIVNQSTEGKDAIRTGLKELMDAGYLIKEQERNPDGTWGEVIWDFYETSQLKESLPNTENPIPDNSIPDNPTLLSTDNKINTEETNLSSVKLKEKVEKLKSFSSALSDSQLKTLSSFSIEEIERAIEHSKDYTMDDAFAWLWSCLKHQWWKQSKEVANCGDAPNLAQNEHARLLRKVSEERSKSLEKVLKSWLEKNKIPGDVKIENTTLHLMAEEKKFKLVVDFFSINSLLHLCRTINEEFKFTCKIAYDSIPGEFTIKE